MKTRLLKRYRKYASQHYRVRQSYLYDTKPTPYYIVEEMRDGSMVWEPALANFNRSIFHDKDKAVQICRDLRYELIHKWVVNEKENKYKRTSKIIY